MEEKKHYYLVAGEIVFTDEEEKVNAIRLNGVTVMKDLEVNTRELGRAQQILQVNFAQRMGEIPYKVHDVVLTSFIYLGKMSQEEFHKTPEGMKLQEKAPATSPVPGPVPTLEEAVAATTPAAANDPTPEPTAPTTAADEVDGQPNDDSQAE